MSRRLGRTDEDFHRPTFKRVLASFAEVCARVLGNVLFSFYGRHDICGMKVVITDPRANVNDCLVRIREGLMLLRDVDPRRFRQVVRYVRRCLVWPGRYTAYDVWGGMHLASRHALQSGPTFLAGAFVHEAAHLRIAKRGIPYLGSLRARIEAVCVKEQAALLRKVSAEGIEGAKEAEAALRENWGISLDQARHHTD
jgi:hypothetical protein